MDPIALTTIIHHGSPMFGSAPTREPGVPGLQDWPTRGAAVNITFFPNAKDMGIAEYAFMAGCLVAVCCGIRLFIRVFQVLEGPKPWPPRHSKCRRSSVDGQSRRGHLAGVLGRGDSYRRETDAGLLAEIASFAKIPEPSLRRTFRGTKADGWSCALPRPRAS
jgi:hypothetical protein